MSLKFSPCGRLSLLRFARNCKQRSSLGTKISAQHSNPSQNKYSVFAKQNVSIKYFALASYSQTSNLQILFAETRTLKMSNLNLRRFASAKQCRHLSRAVGLVGVWGRKGRRFVSRNPFRHPRKRERRIQKGALCFASARNCKAERNLSPRPLYNQVKNNLKRLFFTKRI